MLQEIFNEIKKNLNFPKDDKILFNNQVFEVDQNNFQPIQETNNNKTIAFIDGGQAEILSAGNFSLSLVRVFAQVFEGDKKLRSSKHEFYLFTKAVWKDDDLFYESKIFSQDPIINEQDLLISSYDVSIRTGLERAPISRIANIARRFAELALAKKIEADFVVLDGTLKSTFQNEEKYLSGLSGNICALAKTSSLFTVSGNNPTVLLNKLSPAGCWTYQVDEKTSFVKLHEKAKHVFRFEGNQEVLPFLIQNSGDPLFLGYPYGLIFVDRFARISNEEKKSLQTAFLLRSENKEIIPYLNSADAHEILDQIG